MKTERRDQKIFSYYEMNGNEPVIKTDDKWWKKIPLVIKRGLMVIFDLAFLCVIYMLEGIDKILFYNVEERLRRDIKGVAVIIALLLSLGEISSMFEHLALNPDYRNLYPHYQNYALPPGKANEVLKTISESKFTILR